MKQQRLATVLSMDVVGYSELIQQDRDGLLSVLNAMFRSAVRPQLKAQQGRIVKLVGDGALVEFASSRGAMVCAVGIQRALRATPWRLEGGAPLEVRIGIHAGDVVDDGGDLFGDAVNIAARLEAMVAPGGIAVSRMVVDMAGSGLPFEVQSDGVHRLKNIERPVEVLTLLLDEASEVDRRVRAEQDEEIRFTRADDGVMLAWASHGVGPPVVMAPAWISRLDMDWRNPSRMAFLQHFSKARQLVRFDARGNGLSQRDVPTMDFDMVVEDLRAVFDAAGIARAPIFGLSQGAAVATVFAARYPERVSAIVTVGGYPQGREMRSSLKEKERATALQAMFKVGWDDEYPSLRDLMANLIVPLASTEERRQFAEDMRAKIKPEMMALYREMLDKIDVVSELARVQAPCLVMHCAGDRMQPIEQSRLMAAALPEARFRALDSINHSITANDPVWPMVQREIDAFLAEVAE